MRCLHRLRKKANPAAADAIDEATQNLHRIKGNTPEVQEISRLSRILRERNHFREKLETLIGGVPNDA